MARNPIQPVVRTESSQPQTFMRAAGMRGRTSHLRRPETDKVQYARRGLCQSLQGSLRRHSSEPSKLVNWT